jgi:hypothetical protein
LAEEKLLDRVRKELRSRHYSIKTEKAYLSWIKRFILFHNKKHPKDMGAEEVKAFIQDVRSKRMNLLYLIILSHVLNNLAIKHHVSILTREI